MNLFVVYVQEDDGCDGRVDDVESSLALEEGVGGGKISDGARGIG